MRRSAVLRGLAAVALATVLLAAFFAWGYLAHRNKVFPYPQALRLAIAAGVVEPPIPKTELSTPPDAAQAALQTLAYVSGTPDPRSERSGVYHHEPERAFEGWNLFTPRDHSQAYLVDMNGEVVHRWRARSGPWSHVELLPDGGLLALVRHERLIRLDSRSRILWNLEGRFHHDLAVDSAGDIHILERLSELRQEIHPGLETVVDRVAVISPQGELSGRISLLDLLLSSPYAFLLPSLQDHPAGPIPRALDVLHTNHVEVFDGRLAERSPLYAEGNLLVSLRTPSTILIADPDENRVLWAWGPSNLIHQHHPTLLDNGHLLVFNNGLERSEVIEVDPLTNRVVWRYAAEDFFSRTRGSAQRLPNGNTLITESDTGYAFEVTPAGERVWAFADPFFVDGDTRMAIWRMQRFAPGDPRLPPGVGDGA